MNTPGTKTAVQRTEIKQELEITGDDEDLTLGPAERKAIKEEFKNAAARMKEIADRAQKVAESDLEPEMYSNLAGEACAVTDGLRRLAWKGEALCRDEDGMYCRPIW